VMILSPCLYCTQPAESLEHPLPAAFGEFLNAPLLNNRLCKTCNSNLGLLDEQLARCGPEGFFRRFYGVEGREGHAKVNPFERGSAGGNRLDMRAIDKVLGFEVALECENGQYRQMRQLVFVETKTGKTHCLRIREGTTSEQLRMAFRALGVAEPFETRLFYDPSNETWVEALVKEAWPSAESGPGTPSSPNYEGMVVKFELTERYFRGLAKIGFHYFLTQFRQYSGHETMFSSIRAYIAKGGGGIERANEFIGKRQNPLLGEMLDSRVRPDGWQGHVLCAESKPGECIGYVQMFVSEDWPAPAYSIRLARDSSVAELCAVGHAYVYSMNGRINIPAKLMHSKQFGPTGRHRRLRR
jgi:hypothetical protein